MDIEVCKKLKRNELLNLVCRGSGGDRYGLEIVYNEVGLDGKGSIISSFLNYFILIKSDKN